MAHIRYVHKAEAISNKDTVTESILHISKELPKMNTLAATELIFESDAQAIVDALLDGLPQGTRMRVVKKLLEYEVSKNGYFRGL